MGKSSSKRESRNSCYLFTGKGLLVYRKCCYSPVTVAYLGDDNPFYLDGANTLCFVIDLKDNELFVSR